MVRDLEVIPVRISTGEAASVRKSSTDEMRLLDRCSDNQRTQSTFTDIEGYGRHCKSLGLHRRHRYCGVATRIAKASANPSRIGE
jgi:hypothetical protein